jgi:hypothetical protein
MISVPLILAVALTFVLGFIGGALSMLHIWRYGVRHFRDVRDQYRDFIEKNSGPGEYEDVGGN